MTQQRNKHKNEININKNKPKRRNKHNEEINTHKKHNDKIHREDIDGRNIALSELTNK